MKSDQDCPISGRSKTVVRSPPQRGLPGFDEGGEVLVDDPGSGLVFDAGDLQAARGGDFADGGVGDAGEERFEGGAVFGGDFQQVAAVRFAEEQFEVALGGVAVDGEGVGNVGESYAGAEAAADGHFGQGGGEPAFAEVVAGPHEAGLDGGVQGEVRFAAQGDIQLGRGAAVTTGDEVQLRAAEFGFGLADEIEQVAGGFEVHRHALLNVFHLPQGANQQRGGNLDRFALAGFVVAVFVVEAVFAADERRAVSDGDVVASEGRPHQAAQRFGPVGVAPAEVIENGDPGRIGPHGDAVAHRFVDGASRHVVRIEIGIARVDAAADHNSPPRAEHGPQHGGVAGAVVRGAGERLHHAAALHLVVVLPNHPLFAGDIPAGKHLVE